MPIRDLLAGEDNDARRAADAAAHGRSLTGLSGRHTDADPRFATADAVFGGGVEDTRPGPLIGDRIQPRQIQQIGGLEGMIGNDPMFRRERLAEMVVERQPFGTMEQELAYPTRPGYRRYWFNDKPGRIRRAAKAGYAHVIDPDTRENVSRVTDRVDGRGQSSYLMEIPIKWYQEDMGKQAQVLERRLHDIRTGTAEPESAEQRYVPKQGITVRRSGQAER